MHREFDSFSETGAIDFLETLNCHLNARCKDFLEIRTTYFQSSYALLQYWVEYPHRTMKDFLSRREKRELFQSRAGHDFDTMTVLCRLLVVQIKVALSQDPKGSSIKNVQILSELAHDTLWSAGHIERSQGRSEIALLEELARVQDIICEAKDKLDAEKFCGRCVQPVLISAFNKRLRIYIAYKMDQDPAWTEIKGRPLLDYTIHGRSHLEFSQPDLDMIRLILQRKACPNQKLGTSSDKTVWSSFLLECWGHNMHCSCHRYHRAATGICDVAELLVLYGADLDRECQVQVPDELGTDEGVCRNFKTEVLSASQILKACLPESDWLRLESVIAEKRESPKSSFWGWVSWR